MGGRRARRLPTARHRIRPGRRRVLRARRLRHPHPEPPRGRAEERARPRQGDAAVRHLARDPGRRRRAGVRGLAAADLLRDGRAEGPHDHVPRVRRLGARRTLSGWETGLDMTERRKSRQLQLGRVAIGGDAPVSVQSMTTTKTSDINATLQQIASLVATGVDIVRVAVPHWEDAEALVAIAAKSTVPVVADIHFQWKYAMAALEAGIQGLRINPGNIKYHDKVRLIAREAKARGVPIRIGVNAGSLEKELLEKYGSPTPEALVESAMHEASILEDEDFFDIKISVKHSNPAVMIEAYRQLADACDYPVHLGVTEAGPMPMGGVKSAVGIGTLLSEGIGATIRVSLTDDPVEEVKVGNAILQSLGPRERGLDLVACPSCGRAEVDVLGLTKQVNEALEREGIKQPIRVAVMGCVVNGPGEAREADLGIAAGKGQGFLVVKGEVVDKIPESEFVTRIVAEARKLAAERAAEEPATV